MIYRRYSWYENENIRHSERKKNEKKSRFSEKLGSAELSGDEELYT